MKNPKVYQVASFSSFDKFVCDWLFKQNIEEIDGVFKSQCFYLCDGDEIIVDKVIKLEMIEQGMQEISVLLGKKIILGHHNKSKKLSFVVRSSETLSIIEHIYKKDFEIFSYSLEQAS